MKVKKRLLILATTFVGIFGLSSCVNLADYLQDNTGKTEDNTGEDKENENQGTENPENNENQGNENTGTEGEGENPDNPGETGEGGEGNENIGNEGEGDDPVVEDPVVVASIELSSTNVTLKVGETLLLTATVSPENAENKEIIWTSTNEDVATVDSGTVAALAVGNTTIKATCGEVVAECAVEVLTNVVNVESVSLNFDAYTMEIDDQITLVSEVLPSDATNKEVMWSSSDPEVASVSDNGTVKALKAGETTITVKTQDGNKTATCEITVNAAIEEDPYVPEENDDILTITEACEITLEKNYKQIYVNAPEAKVTINMNGFTVENSENSPIYVQDCDKLEISATKSKTSYVKDTRPILTEEADDQGKGAIYVANGDLEFKGKGTLNVTSSYFNGIHGKDDVEIKNLTLNVESVNHAIRGNDSVTVASGTLNLTCGGDGIHTENTDVSSSGNQRGNVTLNGGTIKINSWGDAVAAAYNFIGEELDSGTPLSFEAKTNKKSAYSGEIVENTDSKLYLKMNSTAYSNGNYTYAAYINNVWYKASYKGTITNSSQGGGGGWGGPGGGPGGSGGGSRTYYVYEIDRPKDATSFKLYRFSGSNVSSFSTSSYNAVSDAKTFNASYDMINISVSSSRITFGSWESYENGISSKGIKAENEIQIKSGTYNITSLDDGLHTNNDASLENGETPLGNVTISGGDITISTDDDGIHADNTLNITGGTINVTTSYEGLEGNTINVSGGETYVYASDDGVNASAGKVTPSINITGGYLDVEVPTSGDTDGIDSNGALTINGGTVIVKGPGSAGTSAVGAAAVDTDGSVTIKSGSLIVFGGIEQTPTSSVTRTLVTSNTVSTGTKTVSFASSGTSYTTTLKTSSRGIIVYSSLGTATLK